MTATRFAIPKDALQQHIIALGKTRSGKSSALRAGFVADVPINEHSGGTVSARDILFPELT